MPEFVFQSAAQQLIFQPFLPSFRLLFAWDSPKVRRVAHTAAAIHALGGIAGIRLVLTVLARVSCEDKVQWMDINSIIAGHRHSLMRLQANDLPYGHRHWYELPSWPCERSTQMPLLVQGLGLQASISSQCGPANPLQHWHSYSSIPEFE